jgi:subtilase family serine protease
MGERFGLSKQDIDTVSGWLQSQGLHVNWVSPSRIFIGFNGTAADVGRAFQTQVNYYRVNGVQRFSVSSPPMIPEPWSQ